MSEEEDVVLEACKALLEFAPENEVDEYALKNLHTAYSKKQGAKLPILANVEWVVNKKLSSNLLVSLANVESMDEFGINFTGMSMEAVWEYDAPTRRLKSDRTGRGGMLHYPTSRTTAGVSWNALGDPMMEKAMIRVYTTKWFIPESIKTATSRPQDVPPPRPPALLEPHVWWEAVRQKGFIPFDITVCAYTQKNRYSFSIDLVNNVLYRDFRYGLFTRKREPRSPLDFLYLDNVLSSNTLKELQRRTLIYIFEVSGVTSQEVAHGFKITETMAQNNLYGLVKKGLLASEGSGSAEKYRIDLERLRENKGLVLAR